MASEAKETCRQHALIEAFARDELSDDLRREAERTLEQSEPCREVFRKLTAGRYPRLENYTIIGQVGKGGFGVVYKAIHHAKERVEALKVLFSKTPLLTSYFQNEVHLIARLQHPNVATLYDAQLSTPPLYYTMEFVEGRRLNDYLRQEEVSLAARIGLIKLVASAVGYAHGEGVVHRDLKPQNVLIDQKGQPHIVDFGIAKKLAEVGTDETVRGRRKEQEGPVGTLGYIAPEQEKGGAVDGRADIFALGALLFNCVTGEPARLARIEEQRSKTLRDRRIVQPDDLSAIIARCVEDSPDDRYAAVEDFVADLDSYLTGRTIQARQNPSLGYRISRVLSLVMREYSLPVRAVSMAVVVGVLTLLMWKIEIYRVGAGGIKDSTVMVGITESTLEAIDAEKIGADLPGLLRSNVKSWRLLYGRLLEKLGKGEPAVVVFDGWMAECTPFDGAFLKGLAALDAPFVMGAELFDVNGEPVMCQEIYSKIKRYGALINRDPQSFSNEYDVTYAIKRGFQTIPSISVAAFAATRYPDHEAFYDLIPERAVLQIRYKVPDARPGQLWYREDVDEISYHRTEDVGGDDPSFSVPVQKGWLHERDLSVRGRVEARPDAFWKSGARTLTVEDVLKVDDNQLLAWIKGKAVIIGYMVPGAVDEHKRANGESIFGCQVHAEAIDTLLAKWSPHRYLPLELIIRNLLWCGVATILVSMVSSSAWKSMKTVTLVCAGVLFAGVVAGMQTAVSTTDPILVELAIAGTGLVGAGSVAYWISAVRRRQLEMSPSSVTMISDGSTLPSTMLAETR